MILTRSRIDKLNLKLKALEDQGITTNTLENIKSALEILNQQTGKRGRQDRFTKSKSWIDNEIMEKLADDLREEEKRIKEALSSDDRLKQYDLTDQDYLDLLDVEDDYITHAMQNAGLSSDQIRDAFNIVEEKGLTKKEYERVIRREIEKAMQDGQNTVGYRTVMSPDKLARSIRRSLGRFKAR